LLKFGDRPKEMLKIFVFILLFFCGIVSAQKDSLWVEFNYSADANHKVYLTGSFNDWNSKSHKLYYNKNRLTISVKLAAGYYYYKFIDNNRWIPDPKNKNRVSDGGSSFNSIIKVGEPERPSRQKNSKRLNKSRLPEPILEDNPKWVDLYYKTWEIAWSKIRYGTDENGFVEKYIDEGYNDLIYQWDTIFMAAFAIYGKRIFPAMESLDNFYNKQRPDGYIQSVYSEVTGKQVAEPSFDEPVINPPLFAWIELRYYQMTNDKSRLKRVLPKLIKYFNWIERHNKSIIAKGIYFTTSLGSGMDNIPREGVGKGGWVDFSSQQALAAKCIHEIAEILGEKEESIRFSKRFTEIEKLINLYCWDYDTGFYRDYRADGTLSATTYIGAFWTLLSEVCENDNFINLRDYLTNPEEFWRPNVVPSLSASDQDYDTKGYYWRGSVWSATNYMVVKGLEKYGDYQLAHRIAHNHIENIARVYYQFVPDEEKIAFEERFGDGYKTIWECYNPEKPRPATRWDNTFYSRQDFVGSSGLGPIAMLIENIIGIDLRADKNLIRWQISREDKHGVNNLQFGKQIVNLVVKPKNELLSFEIFCTKAFDLEIVWNDNLYTRRINPGINIFNIK